ncbi:MAG: 1,4-alpha-glucan branching protein GlgB [Thermodesulfobacteriota bacterium]|nr:1,4-alpha-glucan branching protein GlgB [Thermodesulfobacteriota bacterium]
MISGVSLFTDHDIYLFKEGSHFRLYEKLGSHPTTVDGRKGTLFAVWAPNAQYVSVVGDFNAWDRGTHPLKVRGDSSGIWEGFIPDVGQGSLYKYHIASRVNGYAVDKGDPFGSRWEMPPKTASMVWDLDYTWGDHDWMAGRHKANAHNAPISVLEVHLGSWKRVPEDEFRSLNYLEMAEQLPAYVRDMGFTHVELLPVMEHPFFGSWGYQTLGYFAPSNRYGSPQEFMRLVDALHQAGIGVILDWVPSHFPGDGYGLTFFDGTHLFEHADPKQGYHPDWDSYIFNHGRYEVRSFLISSAMFWLDKYHADGLRVDAVASMLYLDYSRENGEWIPNEYGGKENIGAIEFLRKLNEAVYHEYPDTVTVAEESTDWAMVSRPTYVGGLGFSMKWNMGWMHDTLEYFSKDPVHRKYHQNNLTFSIWYAFTENFVLPLSHDEVVHGKGSLLGSMPGDDWRKMANLRLLYGYMFTHPGKKLLFMGGEFGQWAEWNHDSGLEWHLLDFEPHRGIQSWVKDLNRVYRTEPALFASDFFPEGFEWVDFHDAETGVLNYLRRDHASGDVLAMALNFTPVPRENYQVGVPFDGTWTEILNSDAVNYGGTGWGNFGGVQAQDRPAHGRNFSLVLTLPPLGMTLFKWSG